MDGQSGMVLWVVDVAGRHDRSADCSQAAWPGSEVVGGDFGGLCSTGRQGERRPGLAIRLVGIAGVSVRRERGWWQQSAPKTRPEMPPNAAFSLAR